MRPIHRALVTGAATLACATACFGAATAAARVIPLAPLTGVSIGPVLVGESTLWGHSISQGMDMVLQFADPAGRTRTVLKMSGTTTCDRIDDVVGSPAVYVVTSRVSRARARTRTARFMSHGASFSSGGPGRRR
jgi:hypothetical protein